MARARKPAAAKPLPEATPLVPAAVTPAPPSPPAEGASATEGVAAPDVALVQPSVDDEDAIQPDPGAKGPDGWAVKVTGPAKGRWRAGRHFGPEAVTIRLTELTKAQFDALQSDPELVVQTVETPEPVEPA